MVNLRTAEVSCDRFGGFLATVDLDEANGTGQLVTAVMARLRAVLLVHGLHHLVAELDDLLQAGAYHVHAAWAAILLGNPSERVWVCNHGCHGG